MTHLIDDPHTEEDAVQEKPGKERNCPFYGHALFVAQYVAPNQPPFVLFNSNGNQCALVTTSHSPCQMEIDGQTPNWKTCILVRWARCEAVV